MRYANSFTAFTYLSILHYHSIWADTLLIFTTSKKSMQPPFFHFRVRKLNQDAQGHRRHQGQSLV